MGARSKVLVMMAAALACALALAGCSQQPAASGSSASSGSPAASSASSSASSSSSSSSGPSAAEGTATIGLDYNAGTGYEWTYAADPEGVVELVGRETEDLAPEGVAGGGLRDRFTFSAAQPGEVVLTFDLVRGWETGVDPADTQVYAFTVTDDLQMVLNPYKSDFDNEPEVG